MTTNTTLPGLEAAKRILGLTWEEIAASVRADVATLYRWREGAAPTTAYRDRLERLQELIDEVVRSVGEERVREWLDAPMAPLDNRTPHELIVGGRTETVLGALLGLNHMLELLRAAERTGTRRDAGVPLAERAALAILDDELDELYARMQTPGFLEAAQRAFNTEPRVTLDRKEQPALPRT